MIKTLKLILAVAIFLGGILICRNAFAACSWTGNAGTSASCTTTEISNCVSDASSKTGNVIINLPVCNVTWTTDVTINMQSGFSNVTSLSIIGNGTIPTGLGSAENTKITNKGFLVTTSETKKFRLANIYYTGTPTTNEAFLSIQKGSVAIVGSGGGFRLDHITFYQLLNRALSIRGKAYGVVDSCTGTDSTQFSNTSQIITTAGNDDDGNLSWQTATSLGSADAVYFENNSMNFYYTGGEYMMMFADGDSGARIVVRHNTLTNHYLGGHDASSNGRGTFSYEAYNNKITTTYPNNYGQNPVSLRGSTGVLANNFFYGESNEVPWTLNGPIDLNNYRSCESPSTTPWSDMCNGTARKWCLNGSYFGGTFCTGAAGDCNGVPSNCVDIDSNYVANAGCRCRDQLGCGANQVSAPFLIWGNTQQKGPLGNVTSAEIGNTCTSAIVLGRDYCTPSCTKGTCSTICNSESINYTPYTCPHPLTGLTGTCDSSMVGTAGYNISGIDTTPPAAPLGLTVN